METTLIEKNSNDEGGECQAAAEMPAANFTERKKLDESFSCDSEDSDFDVEFTCTVCKKSFSGLKPLRQHKKSSKHLKALQRKELQKEIDEDLKNLNNSDEEGLTLGNRAFAECSICEKEFTGPESYRQHLRSKNHKRKSTEKKILHQVKEDGVVDVEKLKQLLKQEEHFSGLESDLLESNDNTSSDVLECKDCEKTFNGLTSFYEHMKSKTHEKTLKQKKLLAKLTPGSTSGDRGEDVSTIEVIEEDLVCKICRLSFSGPENALEHLKSKGHSKILAFRKWKKEQKILKAQPEREVSESGSVYEAVKESFHENKSSTEKSDPGQLASAQKAEDVQEKSAGDTDEESEDLRLNTLKSYKIYKNYKKIMNVARSED